MDNPKKIDIKAFQDGNRFIVVFEGLTPDYQKMITSFLGATMEVPGEAAPMKETNVAIPEFVETDNSNTSTESEQEPEVAEVTTAEETSREVDEKKDKYPTQPVFEDGEFKGLTPWHLIDKTDAKDALNGYRYLMSQYKGGNLNNNAELKKACMNAIVIYLNCRFDGTDASAYAEKLSEKQCKLFFDDFADAVSGKNKASICGNKFASWEAFVTEADLIEKQNAVKMFIELFQK